MTAQGAAPSRRPYGVDAAAEADLRRQRAIFEEREEELLKRYPDKNIGICGGEVFVGDSMDEVTDKAEEAYPDGIIYFYGPPVICMGLEARNWVPLARRARAAGRHAAG